MPVKSEPQRRAMWAALRGHSTLGIPKSVAAKFVGSKAHDEGVIVGVGGPPEVQRYAAGVVFMTPSSRVLFLRKGESGRWEFPGGGFERGETAEEAARREVNEEIGYVPEGEFAELNHAISPFGTDYTTFVCHVPGEFQVVLSQEHTASCWAPISDPPEPLEYGVAKFILEAYAPENMYEELNDKLRTVSDRSVIKLEEQVDKKVMDQLSTDPNSATPMGKWAEDQMAIDEASVRQYDIDGRLHVEKTPLTKACINPYWGREIPRWRDLGLDPERKYMLFRHPDELARPETVDSFNNVQLLGRHVEVNAWMAGKHQPNDVVGSTGTDAVYEHPYLYNSLVVWSKDDIDNVNTAAKKELSSGYRYRADMTPGDWEGQHFDGVMRDIVANHVALVKEGRAGPDVVVGDSQEYLMNKITLGGLAARTAIAAFLRPILATDAQIDLAPLTSDLTKKNFRVRMPVITSSLVGLTHNKLAQGKRLEGLDDFLIALDAAMPEETEKEAVKGKDEPFEKDKEEDEDKEGKDKKAKDRKRARDAMEKSLKDCGMDAESCSKAMKSYDAAIKGLGIGDAEPEERVEEEQENEVREKDARDKKARDKAARDKKARDDEEAGAAMDAKIADAVHQERENGRRIREAEQVSAKWVGAMDTMACDSAEDVYKKALEMTTGKKVEGVHPSAYRALLEAQPLPGSTTVRKSAVGRQMAFDSSARKAAVELVPELARIKTAA